MVTIMDGSGSDADSDNSSDGGGGGTSTFSNLGVAKLEHWEGRDIGRRRDGSSQTTVTWV
jgi:hypothetical protein